MKLTVLWVGPNNDPDMGPAIDRYFNRIKHFFPIEVVSLKPEKSRQGKSDVAIMHADSARLLSAVPARGTTVVVDERGEPMTSLKFSRWLEQTIAREPYGIHFVMGGDVGMDETVRDRADKVLSLSAMTLPHQMARLVLMEQIYRACTLMRNIAYHK